MKEYFYIFLDIDGVLWDWPQRIDDIKNGKVKKMNLLLLLTKIAC